MKKETWHDLAKSRMKRLGITQEALAERLGVTQGAIGHWLNKRREPSMDIILNILGALDLKHINIGVDGAILDEAHDSNVSFKQEHVPRGRYPLISWVSAGVFSEAVEPYNRDEIETWHETTVASSVNSFWLEVKGDSMTAPVGLSIPEGMIILVDPEVPPTNGKLVVARIEGQNEATFKRLVVDAGRAFLKPLNPQYPMLEIADDCKIVGVVVDAKLARLP